MAEAELVAFTLVSVCDPDNVTVREIVHSFVSVFEIEIELEGFMLTDET